MNSTPNTNTSPPVLRRQIEGRLHSIGDTVYIPCLGYNGTLLQFKPYSDNYCVVIPHDKGRVQTYPACELKTDSGINTANRIWLRNNSIQVNDTHHNKNLPTQIHHSRHHYCKFRDNRAIDNDRIICFDPTPEDYTNITIHDH